MLVSLTQQLSEGHSLSGDDVATAVTALVDPTITADAKAHFLTALAQKGETVEEIASFATQLRDRSLVPVLDAATRAGEILDVCGTGGDRLNTFNISTTVALIVAAAGVTVAKHGNRAITSQSGSADVLEALGIRIDLGPVEVGRWLAEHRFAFLFAPSYHPAFKHIAPARKLCAERGQRTIFNFLGPLLNPARPTAQLVGVPRPALCEPIARTLQSLGLRRGMVVSGAVGTDTVPAVTAVPPGAPPPAVPRTSPPAAWLDELSTLGENTIAEFHHERGFSVSTFAPSNLPLQPTSLADLAGADRFANASIVRAIASGSDRGPRRDAVLLNAAAALFVAGRCRSMVEGWELAGELLDSGAVERKLTELVAASSPSQPPV
jgi:anthranilate phosphoribosyltransferase